MWTPPPIFDSPARERAFLQDYCQKFAKHRRLAILLGIFITAVYLIWDYLYGNGDPVFRATLKTVLWNRIATTLALLPFLALSLTKRFEHDEAYANAVLLTGISINFLFYCRGFLAVPYPYDYMFFFMGMFIIVVYGFAMLRLRSKPVLLLMGLSLLAAAITFVWNWQLKHDELATYTARIYQLLAFSFLLTMAVIGFALANLLERTNRDAFAGAIELATTNGALSARNVEFEELNLALSDAVTRVERESAARTQVLASASHDLRQPLHALSVYSAILSANPSPDVLGEVSGNIDRLVRSLGDLLHGLLDLSQLSSGHYTPVFRPLALDELLTGICGEFAPAAAAKGLDLRPCLVPSALVGDQLAISRIARNLIDNAIKYTDDGHIGVRLARGAAFTELVVEDTGKGIPQPQQARIFEEFYQVDNQTRDRSKGVGLGLAIVQRLVELIGATIELHSQTGEGSRFTVRIPHAGPACAASAAPQAPPHAPRTDETAEPRRIYLVDDEPDILQSMSALLTTWHYEVRAASHAAQAAALLDRAGAPDLLIADLRLQDGETGLALAERMIHRHGPFPVLFISGETSSQALRSARDKGWQVLHKPVDAGTLRQAIDAALANVIAGRPA